MAPKMADHVETVEAWDERVVIFKGNSFYNLPQKTLHLKK